MQIRILIAALLLAGVTTTAQAAMYKWVDENGVTVYSQTPPASAPSTLIKPPPPPAQAPEEAMQRLQQRLQKIADDVEDKELAEQKQEKEEKRAEASQTNCANAQSNLLNLEGNPRISRIDGFIEDPVGAYWIIFFDREDVVNIGCGFVEGRESREKLIRYLRFLGLRGWKPKGIHTWIIPVHTPQELCTDRVLWIGDSAGMARAESGHGIGDFYRASGPLADTCVRALESGDFSRTALESYQNSQPVQDILERSRKYNRNVKIMLRVQNYVPRFIKRWFVTKVLPRMAARHRKGN